MTASHRIAARRTTAAATALLAGLLTVTTVTTGSATAANAPAAAPASPAVVSEGVVGGLEVENSFVSAVGWVKPGETYPSRVIVRNTSGLPVVGASVTVNAPVGSTIAKAGTATVDAGTYTWNVGALAAGASRTLVLESRAATVAQLPTIVWRDLSTTATVTVAGASKALTSHGPKVIPPGSEYDTARYGDRPFPVVPVAVHRPRLRRARPLARHRASTTRPTRARRSTSTRRCRSASSTRTARCPRPASTLPTSPTPATPRPAATRRSPSPRSCPARPAPA